MGAQTQAFELDRPVEVEATHGASSLPSGVHDATRDAQTPAQQGASGHTAAERTEPRLTDVGRLEPRAQYLHALVAELTEATAPDAGPRSATRGAGPSGRDAASGTASSVAKRPELRVLIGTDGSEEALNACVLTANLDWPLGTTLHLVSAYDDGSTVAALTGLAAFPETQDAMADAARDVAQDMVDAAARRLERPGLAVETAVAAGSPADVLVGASASFRADLLILGHRDLAPFEPPSLGAVFERVIDRATCAVLVARTAGIARILVADDGSAQAAGAADLLLRFAALHGCPALVVSVAERVPRVPEPPLRFDPVLAEQLDAFIAADRGAGERTALATAERLRAVGVDARSRVMEGPPARCLVDAAADDQADLIVIGSHGRSGVREHLLGGVARNVVRHARCSVLVVPSRGRESTR